MRPLLIVFMVFFLSVSVWGQDLELSFWNNIRNSAVTLDDQVMIRCETIELPGLQTYLFYQENNEWIQTSMEFYSGLTYQALIPAPVDQSRFCRFRTEHDTLVAMMPAFIENDNFPPLLAELSEIDSDPFGDTISESITALDMVSTSFGYSDSRFIAALENTTGDYPTDNGGFIPTEFYFYITGIINPENVLQDSVGYAMILADIPFVIDPGLFKISGIEFDLESFERIGDIETAVIDGQLVMACDIETLTGDEDFGIWPSVSNSLGIDMITAQFSSLNLELVDLGKASLQFIDNYQVAVESNILPVLSDPQWDIDNGVTTAQITYFDENANFPLSAQVSCQGNIYQMYPETYEFQDSIIFNSLIPVTDWLELTYSFSDNNIDFVELSVENTGFSPEIIPLISGVESYPNPFNPNTKIKFYLHQRSRVELKIYNIEGALVKTILDQELDPGEKIFNWNAEFSASGLYFYHLKTKNEKYTGKLILIK